MTAGTITSTFDDYSGWTAVDGATLMPDPTLNRLNNVLFNTEAEGHTKALTKAVNPLSGTTDKFFWVFTLKYTGGTNTIFEAVDSSSETILKLESNSGNLRISWGSSTANLNTIQAATLDELTNRERVFLLTVDGSAGATANDRSNLYWLEGNAISSVISTTVIANGSAGIGTIDTCHAGNDDSASDGFEGVLGRMYWGDNQDIHDNATDESDTMDAIFDSIAATVQSELDNVTWIQENDSMPGTLTPVGGPTYAADDQGNDAMVGDGVDNELTGTGVSGGATGMTLLFKMDMGTTTAGRYYSFGGQIDLTGGNQTHDQWWMRMFPDNDATAPGGVAINCIEGSLGGTTRSYISNNLMILDNPVVGVRFRPLRVNGFVNGVESSYVAGERSNNLSGGAVQLGETQRGIRWGSLDGQASTWFDDGQLGGAFYLTEEDISDLMVYVKSQNLKGVTYSAPAASGPGSQAQLLALW